MPTPKRAPTSYEKIKGYSKNLKDYIKGDKVPLGLEKFPYEIIMDIDQENRKGLGRLLAELKCKKILCVLGIGENEAEPGKLEFKISFLGLNDKNEVHIRHKEGFYGEETWPPGDTITDPTIDLP